MFELITTFYNEVNLDRRNEFVKALISNALNPLICKINIICESGSEYILELDDKIEVFKVENRPTFQDLIKFANSIPIDSFKIIANTDIYFDETLSIAMNLKHNEVYCLTRWNQNINGIIDFYPNFKSQDSWIFRSILPKEIGKYYMGVPGCDNRLASELNESSFQISNPSLSLRSIHLHATEKRSYHKVRDRVPGSYAYFLPTFAKDEIKSKSSKKLYLTVRRKYYNAIIHNQLEGVEIRSISFFYAWMLFFYYKLRLKLK